MELPAKIKALLNSNESLGSSRGAASRAGRHGACKMG
jgi:hypothetical protein